MGADSSHNSPAENTFITALRGWLRTGELPGAEAQLSMAPAYRSEINRVSIHEKKCVEAAVLLLLAPYQDAVSIVLTVRQPNLKHHAGQISMPGGRREPGESLRRTALRECEEEIGLAQADIEVLGQLTPLYIPPTHFCVHPYVAATSVSDFQPDTREVQRILRLPVGHLNGSGIRRIQKRTFRDREYDVPYYSVENEVVWGATAMMLAEFAAVAAKAEADARSR